MVQHLPYLRQVVSEYRRLFRTWPQNVGLHVRWYVYAGQT